MKKVKMQGTFSYLGMCDVMIHEKCENGYLLSISREHEDTYHIVLDDKRIPIEEIVKECPYDFLHLVEAYKFSSLEDAKWAYDLMKQPGDLWDILSELGFNVGNKSDEKNLI